MPKGVGVFNQTRKKREGRKEEEWEGERKEGRDKGRIDIQRAKGTSLVAWEVNNLPLMQEAWVPSLGQEDPLEKGMAIHSRILAWRIPRTEKPGGLQSMRSQRVGHHWVTNRCAWPHRTNQGQWLLTEKWRKAFPPSPSLEYLFPLPVGINSSLTHSTTLHIGLWPDEIHSTKNSSNTKLTQYLQSVVLIWPLSWAFNGYLIHSNSSMCL